MPQIENQIRDIIKLTAEEQRLGDKRAEQLYNDAALIKDIVSYADSPMIITGGALTLGTNAGTLKVGVLTALLRESALDTAALTEISLAEQDNVAIPAASTFYQVVLTSTPAIVIQIAVANGTTEIGIGSVMKEADDTVHFAEAGMRLQNGVAKLHRRAATLRHAELASGCVITETGGALTLGIAAGVVYEGINRCTPFSGGAFDSNVADSFTRIYRDGGGGYTKLAAQTVVDSDHYDDNSGGVALITVNQYSVHWIYLHPADEHVYMVYGRDSFKLAEALVEQPYGDLPDYIAEFGVLLGKIITKRGTAIFDDVQMVTDFFFVGTAATSHLNLGDLQGGSLTERYHFTNTEHTKLADVTVGQIAFPAIQNPSADVNTLDDYEEGTWTPDLQFAGAKVGITYGTQSGKYLKIGNAVIANAEIVLTSKGSSNGAARLYGLPFTVSGTTAVTVYIRGITFANVLQVIALTGQAYNGLYEVTEGGVVTAINDGNFADDSILRISVAYQIA